MSSIAAILNKGADQSAYRAGWSAQIFVIYLCHMLLILCVYCCFTTKYYRGARWLSGKELGLRSYGRWFNAHKGHCDVSLSKICRLPLLCTGSTQGDRKSSNDWKLVNWEAALHQHKQNPSNGETKKLSRNILFSMFPQTRKYWWGWYRQTYLKAFITVSLRILLCYIV